MSKEYPITYAVYGKCLNGEDLTLSVNCIDIAAALDMLKADIGSSDGLTKGEGCIIEYCYINFGIAAITFTPTDATNVNDKSGTLAIYFGEAAALQDRDKIEVLIDNYELLTAPEQE